MINEKTKMKLYLAGAIIVVVVLIVCAAYLKLLSDASTPAVMLNLTPLP